MRSQMGQVEAKSGHTFSMHSAHVAPSWHLFRLISTSKLTGNEVVGGATQERQALSNLVS